MWIWQQVGAGWRRFGFAQDMDYEEYGLWEDEDAMEYGEERSGQDSPFDDPFFKFYLEIARLSNSLGSSSGIH